MTTDVMSNDRLCIQTNENSPFVLILFNKHFETFVLRYYVMKVMIGLVYRSPKTNLDDNVLLFDMVEKAANNHKSSRKK